MDVEILDNGYSPAVPSSAMLLMSIDKSQLHLMSFKTGIIQNMGVRCFAYNGLCKSVVSSFHKFDAREITSSADVILTQI